MNRVENDNQSFELIHSFDPNVVRLTIVQKDLDIDFHDRSLMYVLEQEIDIHHDLNDFHYREFSYKYEMRKLICVVRTKPKDQRMTFVHHRHL